MSQNDTIFALVLHVCLYVINTCICLLSRFFFFFEILFKTCFCSPLSNCLKSVFAYCPASPFFPCFLSAFLRNLFDPYILFCSLRQTVGLKGPEDQRTRGPGIEDTGPEDHRTKGPREGIPGPGAKFFPGNVNSFSRNACFFQGSFFFPVSSCLALKL